MKKSPFYFFHLLVSDSHSLISESQTNSRKGHSPFSFLLFPFLLWLLPLFSFAQETYPSFLPAEAIPNGAKYLPAPPDTASMNFFNDWVQYNWGKSLRDTPRGRQAIRDASMDADSILLGFSEAFGQPLSTAATPAISYVINRVLTSSYHATKSAKKHFNRKRPFVQYNEGTLIPSEEASHVHSGSYPSSHSSAGWAVALVLAELNPAHQEAILKRGYEYGQSRVIAGYHYQSDVDIARLAASAAVARLHSEPSFTKAMIKAKREVLEK